MIENKVIDIVQPDLNYNGGFIRGGAGGPDGAQSGNMWICPHNTQTGAASVNICSSRHHAEYRSLHGICVAGGPIRRRRGTRRISKFVMVSFPVPTGPGLGLTFDPEYLKKATVVKA